MTWRGVAYGIFLRAMCAGGAIFAVTGSCSADEIILHRFHGGVRGADPNGIVAAPENGVLNKFIGTTREGGTGGFGAVFMVDREGKMKILHSFKGNSEGGYSTAPPISDGKDGWYGTTGEGAGRYFGNVFRIDRKGNYSTLYSFAGGADGANPGSLIRDTEGNLYGTTPFGGSEANCQQSIPRCGTVFKVAPDGTETVLWRFQGGSDGAAPLGELVIDAAGNLYGTTPEGGGFPDSMNPYGCGTVFKLTPQGQESILHAFKCGIDGASPEAGLVRDHAGNLYGTTAWEGCVSSCHGTVFKLTPDGEKTILYVFSGNHGVSLRVTPTFDPEGNLYGTEWRGDRGGGVFEITADGREIDLYKFKGGRRDGSYPIGRVIVDGEGNLFGITGEGSGGRHCINQLATCGAIFEFTAAALDAIRLRASLHRHTIPHSP